MSDDENAELVHDWESDCYVLRDEITRLRAALAAVTAERDRMREALRPFIVVLFNAEVEDLSTGQIYGWGFEKEHLLRARAALEGVTEKSGAGNE